MSDTILVSPDGKQFNVPSKGIAELKAKGFRDLTELERKENENQEKFGGTLGKAGALVSGAASGLTFGLSDAAIATTPLAQANREATARNPDWQSAGQMASLAIPFAGELAGASAAGKVAKGAGAAITGVSKGAGALGEAAAMVAPKAIAPIVKGAVAAGSEGAAFQIGANVGAASRRDVDLDAETLLAHTGEAAILGGGVGAALPIAGKVAKWTADKALSGLESGVQTLREAGFRGAGLAIDGVDAAAGAIGRNSGAIGGAIEGAARGTAGALDNVAGSIVGHADDIGGAMQGAGRRIAEGVDEHLLPRIRKGLTEQTGRADIVDDVFATGAEGAALRKELGPQTITGTRQVEAEKLSEGLNKIWETSLDHDQMFSGLAKAVKQDLQAAELAATPMSRAQQRAIASDVLARATATQERLLKFDPKAAEIFDEAIQGFGKSLKSKSSEGLYEGLDRLKVATDKISKFAKGATGDMSIGAGAAADAAREFGTFARQHLEDTATWGAAGAIQHEVNAAYRKYIDAFAHFKKEFAHAKAEGSATRVLDGAKITKWARDINSPAGEVRNVVVDDLVQAQADLINLTDRLSKRAQQQARETLGSSTASELQRTRAAATEAAPDAIGDVLSRSLGQATDLGAAKAGAIKTLDRAEVLQQTQSAILSRQGAGVNPLPVELAQKLGGGALVGGLVGGIPGAVLGGGITSVLQKYGAITSNPKSAIEFLNKIESLRGIDKERVSSWIKATLGETEGAGFRGALQDAAKRVDGKKIGESIRSGADAVQGALPGAREGLANANRAAARAIVDGAGAGRRGLEALASRSDGASDAIMQRLLPAVSYADVTNSTPDEWWKRTQRTIANAQANPQKMLDKLHADLEGVADDLPQLAEALSRQQLKVLGYLAEQMPRNPRPYMLGNPDWKPDPSAMKAYRDLVLVATKPDALLPLITVGTATRAQVDAVKLLWPKTYEDTKAQVTSAVMEAATEGHPVPYQARIRLGQLLQVPLDASQEPGFARWMQTPTQEGQQTKEAQAPTLKGNLNLHSDKGLPMSMATANR